MVLKSDSESFLSALLNRYLRVELSDGRTVIGIFLCTDNQPNIILGSAREYWLDSNGQLPPGEESRAVGLVMAPPAHIKKISVLEDDRSAF